MGCRSAAWSTAVRPSARVVDDRSQVGGALRRLEAERDHQGACGSAMGDRDRVGAQLVVEYRYNSSIESTLDIDPHTEEIARRNGHAYHLTTFEQFDTNERFDIILMLNLIEHVADPVAVLRKAKELLRPGGRIWIKTPNYDALDARIFKNRSWGGFHTPRHFVLFTKDSLVRHCEATGFTVARCSYTQGAPFWTVSVINELRKLGLCTVTASRPSLENSLTPLFHIVFAAFDFLRMPFAKTSQINIHLTVQS